MMWQSRILAAAGFLALMMPVSVQANPSSLGLRAESQQVATPSASKRPEFLQNASVQKPPLVALDALKEAAETTVIFPKPLKRIVIDPGHGGTNEGAVGVAGIHEKHLTLQVALILADRLRARMPDVEIILTRQRDVNMSLAERIEVANRAEADLFLSLHFNSSMNPEAIGFESFWAGDFWEKDLVKAGVVIDDETRQKRTEAALLGQRMATSFNHAMGRHIETMDRGVKPGDYTVLTRAEVPAVVLEMAFLSHAKEGIDTVTQEYRLKLVNALVDAVVGYTSKRIF